MVRTPGRAISRQRRSASATTLPASRISPSSRADFSSGAFWNRDRNTGLASPVLIIIRGRRSLRLALVLAQRLGDAGVDRLDVADAGDLDQQPDLAVVV